MGSTAKTGTSRKMQKSTPRGCLTTSVSEERTTGVEPATFGLGSHSRSNDKR